MFWAYLISEESGVSHATLTALQWLTVVIVIIGSYVSAYIFIYIVYAVRKFLKNRKRKKEQEE